MHHNAFYDAITDRHLHGDTNTGSYHGIYICIYSIYIFIYVCISDGSVVSFQKTAVAVLASVVIFFKTAVAVLTRLC